jgi:ABC-type nickel/cobalt efflux system permease component RcnA
MSINRSHRRRSLNALLILGVIWSPLISRAHPMGNFSINHWARLKIEQKSVEIRYLIDMAEIPAFQEMRQFDFGPTSGHPATSRYLTQEVQLLKQGLSLDIDGQAVRLEPASQDVTFAEGAGGLPTMRVSIVFRGKVEAGAGARKLSYNDRNFDGRAGWKEVVVVGDGVAIVDSSAPSTDRSQELANYSSDVLNSPPQQLSATVTFKGSGATRISKAPTPLPTTPSPSSSARTVAAVTAPAAIAPAPVPPPGRNTPRSRFTELIGTQGKLSFWFLLSAALIAAGLGALHALEPGHGKTVVAAYLVGSRGTARHAVLLGIVVTASHTAGVYLLGLATLYASRYIVPEQLYPWLGAISGLSVAGLGIFMFLRNWTGETGEHSHVSGESHSHWFLSLFKRNTVPASPAPQAPAAALSLRELCMLGVVGGIVPCPAALVVLLSAFSLHRIGFGLFLITAFSLGLAAVLMIVGLTMVYAKRAMSTRMRTSGAVLRYLPFLSSAFMVVLGVGIVVSAVGSLQLWQGLRATDRLVPFVTVILLGLFLGVRHSTDPDHVVAVATIVSRQGSVRSSAIIGLLWGLGHTLTIFMVGSVIIIFGVVIPPRLGLSMEFCVALMLILLGVLNLTGVMGWLTARTASMIDVPGVPRPAVAGRLALLHEKTVGKLGLYQTLRPLAVGLVHGLAGSAAVALLVLSTIKSPLWSTAYLLIFGFGTMAGMMLMTAAISMPMVYTTKKFFNINRYLVAISGVASMSFGAFLVYRIGFIDGLFKSQVHWIPQ